MKVNMKMNFVGIGCEDEIRMAVAQDRAQYQFLLDVSRLGVHY